MYKAKKLGTDRHWDETFNDFTKRVMNIKAYGVKFKIGIACEESQIDKTGLTQHRAMADVILMNEIFKKLISRELQTPAPSQQQAQPLSAEPASLSLRFSGSVRISESRKLVV
jgi:DNA polymerase III epsilon subunit-like protein